MYSYFKLGTNMFPFKILCYFFNIKIQFKLPPESFNEFAYFETEILNIFKEKQEHFYLEHN